MMKIELCSTSTHVSHCMINQRKPLFTCVFADAFYKEARAHNFLYNVKLLILLVKIIHQI